MYNFRKHSKCAQGNQVSLKLFNANFSRLIKNEKSVHVYIKSETGDKYDLCFKLEDPVLGFQGYLGFTADNFDDKFVSDVNINSLSIYNKDINSYSGKPEEDDETVDTKRKLAMDIMHKYKLNKDVIPNSKKGKKNSSFTGDDQITANDDRDTLMLKLRGFQEKYESRVQAYSNEMKNLDSNTAQMIEFSRGKALGLSIAHGEIERRVNELYDEYMRTAQGSDAETNKRAEQLRELIYAVEQQISKRKLFLIVFNSYF